MNVKMQIQYITSCYFNTHTWSKKQIISAILFSRLLSRVITHTNPHTHPIKYIRHCFQKEIWSNFRHTVIYSIVCAQGNVHLITPKQKGWTMLLLLPQLLGFCWPATKQVVAGKQQGHGFISACHSGYRSHHFGHSPYSHRQRDMLSMHPQRDHWFLHENWQKPCKETIRKSVLDWEPFQQTVWPVPHVICSGLRSHHCMSSLLSLPIGWSLQIINMQRSVWNYQPCWFFFTCTFVCFDTNYFLQHSYLKIHCKWIVQCYLASSQNSSNFCNCLFLTCILS